MTIVKRLRLLTAVLGVTAASAAVVTTVFGDVRPNGSASSTPARPVSGSTVASTESIKTRFSDQPAVSYKTEAGETVFAWQIKPQLAASAARPRDVLVMVDTSASQAGPSLVRARNIVSSFARDAGPEDRIDLWTINLSDTSATRSLTNGFHAANSDTIHAAIAKLAEAEYGSGAVDLKNGLEQASKQFEGRAGRNQIILYLGDGESAASKTPLTEPTRVELGNQLAEREIAFFAVPLGVKVHGQNLHGLATITGGLVVRLTEDVIAPGARTAFVNQLKTAFDTPVLRSDRVTFGPEGVEFYPTRLPPLRADRSTLVIGRLKEHAQTISARVEGRVNGNRFTADLSERLPAPAPENYFLAAVLKQWRDAPSKDAPAALAADRALSMAAEQFRLFRDEFTIQAIWAISSNHPDHAEKLFEAAARIDPENPEVKAGMRVLAKVRAGELKSEKVKARIGTGAKIGPALEELSKEAAAPNANIKVLQPAPQPGTQPPAPSSTSPAERDLIAQAKAAQAVLEQEFRVLVDDTIRRGRRLLRTDPDSAYEDLKRQRDSISANDQLSAGFRQRLVQDLEATMREVQLQGAEIKRQLSAQRERIAQSRQRLNEFDRQLTLEEQTRARISSFKELMSQARFELAQQEAQVMIQERVSRGERVPPEAVAAYRIGQSATHLREWHELRRLREDRYLLSMMQTEKSFIPYPDEPPVHFPPAAVWRQLTSDRVKRYGTMSLGEGVPPSFERIRSLLEGETDRRVNIRNLTTVPSLDALLTQLSQEFQDFGVRFVYRHDMFPPDAKPGESKIRTTSDLSGLPLGAFLDTVLRDMDPPMSWIARPEYIEIGPGYSPVSAGLRYGEKVTRVFDVAELIVEIPSSVNPSTLYSSIQFQGAFMTIFGSSFVPSFGINGNGLNPFGQGGGFNNPFGGGQLGQQGGQLGQLGQQGGQLGQMGGQLGQQGGIQGGAGFTGVQGGLAGQFGIQGNDQSPFLVQLITSVVAPKEWDLQFIGGAGANQQPLFTQDQLAQFQPEVDPKALNSLGFYPPAKALVVRASHRYHLAPSFKLKKSDGAMGAGGPGLPREGGLAKTDPKNPKPANGGELVKKFDPVSEKVNEIATKSGRDPSKLWNLAFDSSITDPRLVIEATDILYEMKEFGHATEALKASLRKGRSSGDWVHDALAIALKSGQAAPSEVERAVLSSVDLDPSDPRAYLKAARGESELGRYEVALAYCQRAASLEPNLPSPYANALVYAEKATDVKSDVVHWASINLLHRDWPADGIDYQAQAKDRISKIAKKLEAAGRKEDAVKLEAVAGVEKTRDLVVELLWQGKADLDLAVSEPSGSRCLATNKRTTGGGILQSDILEQIDDGRSEIYTASQAFAGTYSISVRSALGKPLGNRATLKVIKYQGTPRESVEVYSVDLNEPKPIQVRLESGSRTELATLPLQEQNEARLSTTFAPSTPISQSGISSGLGGGSDYVATSQVSGKSTLPVVSPTLEGRVAGSATGLPGLRVEAQISADRSKMVLAANPVFSGPAKTIPTPKVNILPGGE